MEIKLIELKLENFKGIKSFTFCPGGDNATIWGDNATGKTTLADAFRWLLFGKDTHDKADFQIKTVTAQGDEIPALDHTVSAAIQIDGVTIELKKTYKEKWTKKRGEAKKQLTGHTTDYFIDGVPCQKKKWDSRLADMIDEEAFKLVTLPSYFSSLHWQKRREILLDVCGDVSDIDVYKADATLKGLNDILGDHTLDDHRKVIKVQKEKINDRLKEIPARIDELAKTLPTDRNRPAIEAFIKHLDHKIEQAKDDTELSALRKELAEAQVKLSEAQAVHAKIAYEANSEVEDKIIKLKGDVRGLKDNRYGIHADIKANQLNINRNTKNMDMLRSEYTRIADQDPPHEKICFNCNQPYPESMINDSEAKFKANQAKELAEINAQGKELKTNNEALKKTNEHAGHSITLISGDIENAEKEIAELEGKTGVTVTPPGIVVLAHNVSEIEEDIQNHKTTDTSVLEAERREEMEKLAALDASEKTKVRLEELKAEEKTLSAEFEDLESQIFLMEKFIVQKVSMLEEKINSKFDLARFKLFDVQINEGIKETCITTVNGVPYGAGLNKGMEINVGLDILKTLSEHYEVRAPVWIDNAEAVTKLLDIPSQTFKLIVSDKHKEMEVEYG